jgi:hypothetical protein
MKAGSLWTKCWECAASSFSSNDIETLLHTIARLTYSQESLVLPPPIFAVDGVIKKYLKSAETSGAKESLLAAETTLNVVRKLLSFEWEDKLAVKDVLVGVLEVAAKQLQRRHVDHRDTIRRIDELLDLLEKPWQVKEKAPACNEEDSVIESGNEDESSLVPYHHYSNWKRPTVKWLCYGPTFSPSSNPKFQGPSTKSQGVYKSREQVLNE